MVQKENAEEFRVGVLSPQYRRFELISLCLTVKCEHPFALLYYLKQNTLQIHILEEGQGYTFFLGIGFASLLLSQNLHSWQKKNTDFVSDDHNCKHRQYVGPKDLAHIFFLLSVRRTYEQVLWSLKWKIVAICLIDPLLNYRLLQNMFYLIRNSKVYELLLSNRNTCL